MIRIIGLRALFIAAFLVLAAPIFAHGAPPSAATPSTRPAERSAAVQTLSISTTAFNATDAQQAALAERIDSALREDAAQIPAVSRILDADPHPALDNMPQAIASARERGASIAVFASLRPAGPNMALSVEVFDTASGGRMRIFSLTSSGHDVESIIAPLAGSLRRAVSPPTEVADSAPVALHGVVAEPIQASAIRRPYIPPDRLAGQIRHTFQYPLYCGWYGGGYCFGCSSFWGYGGW